VTKNGTAVVPSEIDDIMLIRTHTQELLEDTKSRLDAAIRYS